jgi:hypothetical protein
MCGRVYCHQIIIANKLLENKHGTMFPHHYQVLTVPVSMNVPEDSNAFDGGWHPLERY